MENRSFPINQQSRIGIIGAGAAGLTAAETLRKKGYTDVTVLERENRAGGKCYSIPYEDRSYELGAGIVSANNRTILSLAKQFHVPVERIAFGQSLIIHPETGESQAKTEAPLQLLFQALFRYRPAVKKSGLKRPGFANGSPKLSVPFSEWAKQNKVELLAKQLEHFFTGFGYGYFDKVPAAYVLKYYSWGTLLSFAFRRIYKFPNGIQHLWTTIAAVHNVRYGMLIEHVKRDTTVEISAANQTFEFDALIITSPLDETLAFLDASPEEHALFSQIKHHDYRTYACLIHGFPKKSGYFPKNYSTMRSGHPVFWYQRYPDSDLYTFYILADFKLANDEVVKNIEAAIQKQGGKIEEVIETAHWKYFPYVDSETMRSGYYDKLEKLQGSHRTFYAGEIMNFSTVGLTSEYSEYLVNKHF